MRCSQRGSEGSRDASLEPTAAQPLESGKRDVDSSSVSHPGVVSHIGVETAHVNISGREDTMLLRFRVLGLFFISSLME
jgi:hypothetical protein